MGGLVTALETLDMAFALLRQRRPAPAMSVLDFKLGIRMLMRYPGLTVMGGLAIAFAICAGAGMFELLTQVAAPKLPFEGGGRLVALELFDTKRDAGQNRALFGVGVWQEELTTVEELGAFQSVTRNVIVEGAAAYVVAGAVMDAAGFRITGVDAKVGRTFTEEDERPGAPPVVVIGHNVWQSMFGGDPAILGRVVQVGTEPATIVGVMPEGFAFPVAHELWLPLKVDPRTVEPGEGPAVSVFARLAPGVSRDAAQAQLTVIGFTVSRRTREIGVRVALGAPRTRVVLAVFRKPLVQVALGLLAGGLLTAFLLSLPDTAEAMGRDPAGSVPSVRELAVLGAYMAGMAAICLLGGLTPMRRALAVEPSEALRAE